MSTTKTATHTPGDWAIHPIHRAGHHGSGYGINAGDVGIGRTYKVNAYNADDPQQGKRETIANARLIAAAPDLLEALKNLLAYANHYSDTMAEIGRGAEGLGELADSVSVAGMARAAIARAEGRPE